jgi:DNA-binding MarR family transcriptional regulator
LGGHKKYRNTIHNRRVRVSQAEYEALADFRQAVREFVRFSETATAAAGLTPRQHQALLAIRGTHGEALLSVGELAQRLYVRHHSAVGLVDRLASLGLVARRTGKPDRRRVLVALTAAGRRVLARLSAAHREELRHLGPRLRAALEAVTLPTLGGRPASQGAREVSS